LSWIYVRVNSFKVNKGISREQRWRERERDQKASLGSEDAKAETAFSTWSDG
jgi:hypothetical protein